MSLNVGTKGKSIPSQAELPTGFPLSAAQLSNLRLEPDPAQSWALGKGCGLDRRKLDWGDNREVADQRVESMRGLVANVSAKDEVGAPLYEALLATLVRELSEPENPGTPSSVTEASLRKRGEVVLNLAQKIESLRSPPVPGEPASWDRSAMLDQFSRIFRDIAGTYVLLANSFEEFSGILNRTHRKDIDRFG